MNKQYEVHCSCGATTVTMSGTPIVHAFCHCEDCRELLNVPYHSVVAWESEDLNISAGQENTAVYQHPTLDMKRIYCTECGDTVYNTNAMGWKIVSQLLIRKCYNNQLPEEFKSNAHFYYDRRIVDIDDQLPKRT